MSCSKTLHSSTYSLLTSSQFSSGGIKMQLINIHLADKGPLVIKFAKHWFIIVAIFRRIVFEWTTLRQRTPKQLKSWTYIKWTGTTDNIYINTGWLRSVQGGWPLSWVMVDDLPIHDEWGKLLHNLLLLK